MDGFPNAILLSFSTTLFQPRNVNHTVFHKISNFLQFASPHHKIAIFSGAIAVFVLFILMCFIIACLKPQFLDFFCKCCFSKTCCFHRLLQKQIAIKRAHNQTTEDIKLRQPLRRQNYECIVNNPICHCLTPNFGICKGRVTV